MFNSSTYKISVLYHTYRCATWSVASVSILYLQNHRVTLLFWVSNLLSSLCALPLPTGSLSYTILADAPPQVQPIFVRYNYTITKFQYSFCCSTPSAGYLCKFYLENHCVTLLLLASNFMCWLCLLVLRTEFLCYTTFMDAPLYVQTIFVSSTESITVLHCFYGCSTLCVAYVYEL